MDPDSRRGPAREAGPDIIIDDAGWRRLVPRAEQVARRAARAAGGAGTIMLASDRTVRGLNARHRGRNKPTNVLTFDSGDIVLALGVVRREAEAQRRRPAHHLAHLVVHGALHLQGPRPRRARRGPPHGDAGSPAAAPDRRAQPVADRMSGQQSLLGRIHAWLGRRNGHTLRASIAELVQQSANEIPLEGMLPELDRQERALLANVLRLRGRTADDVMVPRADIVAIPVDLSLEQVLAKIRIDGHSRLPVYREQLDDVAGMVHIKDVFGYVGRPEQFRLEQILRRPLMVAPQMPVLDLLLQMRQARVHLALVIDEYGGIDGLLTIEDLVEEIVGDISDEHDEVALPMITERPDGAVDLDARLSIEAFEKRLGAVLTEDEREADIDTVGGLVFTLAGRVPTRGEVVSHASGLEFRILESDPRRIRRIRARQNLQQAAE